MADQLTRSRVNPSMADGYWVASVSRCHKAGHIISTTVHRSRLAAHVTALRGRLRAWWLHRRHRPTCWCETPLPDGMADAWRGGVPKP